jgi:hypothetical protein
MMKGLFELRKYLYNKYKKATKTPVLIVMVNEILAKTVEGARAEKHQNQENMPTHNMITMMFFLIAFLAGMIAGLVLKMLIDKCSIKKTFRLTMKKDTTKEIAKPPERSKPEPPAPPFDRRPELGMTVWCSATPDGSCYHTETCHYLRDKKTRHLRPCMSCQITEKKED